MAELVLALNAGSSTLKFQVVSTDAERMAANKDEKLARGTIERIGGEAVYTLRGKNGEPQRGTEQMRDHPADSKGLLGAWKVERGGPAGPWTFDGDGTAVTADGMHGKWWLWEGRVLVTWSSGDWADFTWPAAGASVSGKGKAGEFVLRR